MSISSLSSPGGSYYAAPATKTTPGTYTSNAGTYGPGVASVMGVADAIGDSAGAVCSFSAESLERLGSAISNGFDSLDEALTDIGASVGSALDRVEQGIEDAATGFSALWHEGVEALSDAGEAIENTAASIADTTGDAVSSVVDGIGHAAKSVAAYAAVGANAVQNLLSEVA